MRMLPSSVFFLMIGERDNFLIWILLVPLLLMVSRENFIGTIRILLARMLFTGVRDLLHRSRVEFQLHSSYLEDVDCTHGRSVSSDCSR